MAQTGIDVKRVSLLDIVNANQSTQREVVSRITCVAKLMEHMTVDKAKNMQALYQQLIKHAVESNGGQSANLGGLLLAYPTCYALQLEGASHDINGVLRAIQDDMPGAFVANMRVVSLTDDVPHRLYYEWSFAYAQGDSKEHADTVDPSLAVKAASDINLQFIGFSEQLRELKGNERQEALDAITTYWEGIPQAEAILSLLPFQDAPTVAQFLVMFEGPVNIDLETERVWPMPKMPQVKI